MKIAETILSGARSASQAEQDTQKVSAFTPWEN